MRGRRSWITLAVLASLAFGATVAFTLANRGRLSPVVPGRKAPNFVAYDLQGARTTLRDYRGKVLLVNIWATWCSPCQEEMPSMQRLFEAVDREDFEILAVSIDAPFGEEDATGRRGGDLAVFAERMGLTFRILHDPTGRIQEIYQTTGVPESFVIDRQGVIYKKVAGAMAWDAPPNLQLIQRLLGE
jgi:peroxiredoxin